VYSFLNNSRMVVLMSEATLLHWILMICLYSKVEKLKIENTKKNPIVPYDQTMKIIRGHSMST
jgi:hypothetical protein